MIAKDQNIALLTVANAANKNPAWTNYANYCLDRERGFRKQAFIHLDKFLESTTKWTLDEKIEFLKFIFSYFENLPQADYGPFPQPLSDRFVKPTLIVWCDLEKIDNNPFRWFGKYYQSEEHLFKALDLNPADDLARQAILTRWTSRIYFSVHHLPDGYIGDPFEDIKLGEKIYQQIQLLTTEKLREYWTKEADEDLELVRNYIAWKVSGHSNLEKWGQENNKRVSYGITRVYYDEK